MQERPEKYVIIKTAGSDATATRFFMFTDVMYQHWTAGNAAMFRPGDCAKALATWAFDEGAREVDHRYDLKLDDCPEHTLSRVKV